MRPSYYDNLNASFNLFINNQLGYFAEAYTNYSGQLYETTDPNFSNFYIYGSPFRQWIADSSIPGAYVPSGINTISGFTTGVYIDYERGRVLSTEPLINPTAAYSIKQFSIYSTPLDEADLLIEQAFQLQSPIPQATGALFWNQETVPAIYVKLQGGDNVPWAFGGLDQSDTRFTCIVIADNPYSLDSCCSYLNDSARKYFTLLQPTDFPFNVYGALKSGTYSYPETCRGKINAVMIDTVKTSKFTEQVNKQINKEVWVGLVDFKVIFQRQPRQYFP